MRLSNQEVPMLIGESSRVVEVKSVRDSVAYTVPVWKRALDITCILLSLPVLVPVGIVISLIIKCASPGPVLYLNERVGYRGRRFVCFKFRTMKANADDAIHRRHLATLMSSNAPMVKMDAKGDPRLIPFGGILRSTGLDELPQLLNVLGGEMSLVGPRPCLPYEYDNYLPSQKRRFESLPGLTGLWQVSGKNNTSFSEMIALDIKYAETKSLWMDLKIMVKTIPALIIQVIETRQRRKQATATQLQGMTAGIAMPSITGGSSVARTEVRELVQK